MQIADCERELRRLGVDHPYVPLLRTVPGIGWVLGYTIASEIGDIARFATPKKLTGYTGLCPLVCQSGDRDDAARSPRTVPATCAGRSSRRPRTPARHPVYRDRYERTKQRLGRQRGAKVARVDIARELADAIWHMLTSDQPFAPAGPTSPLVA